LRVDGKPQGGLTAHYSPVYLPPLIAVRAIIAKFDLLKNGIFCLKILNNCFFLQILGYFVFFMKNA